MSLLHTLAAFVVALAVLIVVHEYGHYLAARLCRVKVLRFSVGFGKPLFTRRIGPDQTEWSVAAVPFGGYVKMLDEREGPVAPAERERAFNRQSVWRRILIVAAGPLFNFLFAIAVYWCLYLWGIPELRPVISAPPAKSLAAAAGLRAGDRITAIDEAEIASWQDLRWKLLQAGLQHQQVRLAVDRGTTQAVSIDLDLRALATDGLDGAMLDAIGLRLARPPLPPVLGEVVARGAAARAGLVTGDRVLQADDRPLESWEDLVAVIRARPALPLRLGILRGELTLAITVVPDEIGSGEARVGRIGAAPQVPEDYGRALNVIVRYGLVDSLSRAIDKTWDIAIFSLRMIGRMLIGDVSWKHISGPVTIADIAGQTAQLGWLPYVTFLALISISLGVLNLLPIPLLDGGHLMYYAIEIIKGSPVSERVLELGQRVGLTLLLLMMAFAFYNDINRLVAG